MVHEMMVPYEQLNTCMNAAHPPGERCYMTSKMLVTFDPELMLEVSERHRQMTEASPGFKLVSRRHPLLWSEFRIQLNSSGLSPLQQVLCQPFRFKVGSAIASDASAFPYRSPQVRMTLASVSR